MGVDGELRGEREDRFRAVFDACYPRIMAYAMRRTATVHDAEDVTAETFAVVWRRLDDVPLGEPAVAWAYAAARRCLANHYRGRDRRRRLGERLAAEAAVDQAGTDPEFEAVHDALGRLSPTDREILTLSAWDRLTNEEIGAILRVGSSAVAVRLHRARRRLERALARSRDGVQSAGPSRTHGVVKGAEAPRREDP